MIAAALIGPADMAGLVVTAAAIVCTLTQRREAGRI